MVVAGDPGGEHLRVHGMLPRSKANGPGTRYTVWVQGCSLGCAGCFNPGTHPRDATESTSWPVHDLADLVLGDASDLDGVTLTGGEPLEQPAAVASLCRTVKARSGLGIVLLTGFSRGEIEAERARLAAVAHADMVIAGRYNAGLHLGTGLRGSSNKVFWARTERYSPHDFDATPELEISIGALGELTVTGMHRPGELVDDVTANGSP